MVLGHPTKANMFHHGAARDYFKEVKLGVIEEGAWADMLIYNTEPTKDITIILDDNNLKMIMKDGMIYKNTLKK